ncbi:uncharacterized protein LOC133038486 [Cannabis sativa]|uniref:uncharacterized protein LOC133038486 n=1 Tax=Cannabis sativa TaxID=3483 RepID=UPI0029CAA70E|nr:uncharacterized protein LOC133038486 [Cannabis sativa]
MRGIAWNCRGLGQTSTVRELKSLIRARSPDFVFLTELKVDAAPLVRLLKSMHFYFNIFVPPVGTAGGIILLWKYGFSFECIACSRNHISGIVYSDPPSHPWLLSYVYGPPYFHAKKQFWLDIMKLGDKFGGPWLILGDTNFVLSHSERQGSSGTDQFIPFISSLVESRGLINLLIQGDQLTWDNHRAGRSHVKSALDKGIVNAAWLNLFPKTVLCSSQTCNSDHRPLCLMTNGMEGKVKRGFKFEEGWTRDNRSNLVVDQAWNSVFHSWAPARAFRRVGATRVALLHWNRTQYGKMDTVIKELENKLNWVQSLPAGSRDWTTERSIRRSLNDALERKDMYWKQRARISWIKEGDKCSKFFFLSATIRHRRNAIESILNNEGVWISDRESIGREFVNFFTGIFNGSDVGQGFNCSQFFQERIQEEEKEELVICPSQDEIKRTLFEMGNHKAPGPDGMSVLFFKHYWETVGEDFCKAVSDFFVTGNMHRGINTTNIVLIPKVPNPTRTNHFRPISLCNVLYKVISKIIANRIKPLLPTIICPTQAAFVPGRTIQDNNVIVQEIIHSFNRKKGKEGFFAIKIDLVKAYDRLSWRFIDHVLSCYGIPLQFRRWISQANVREAKGVWHCLEQFCAWSGQQVNRLKTTIFFSKNTPPSMKRVIKETLGIGSPVGYIKYLGLPLFRSKQKDADFNFIIENLTSKLQGWKAKTLSKAGRATLIKSVGLSMPMYAMQTTKLSNRLVSKIDGMVRDFWWGFDKGNHGVHLRAWDKLCLPKSHGGLGFRKTREMNLAFLAKWGWNLLNGCNSLCCRILQAKYLKGKDLLSHKYKSSDSWFWKNVIRANVVLRKGACKLVGDGQDTSVWRDPWIPHGKDFSPKPVVSYGNEDSKVADLLLPNGGWDITKLNALFNQETVTAILKGGHPSGQGRDRWVWTLERNGKFSCKSAYLTQALERAPPCEVAPSLWNKLWNSKVLERHKMLWWCILSKALPIRAEINKRFSIEDSSCPLCGRGEETFEHLFLSCEVAFHLWRSSPWGIYPVCNTGIQPWDWVKFIWDLKHKGVNADDVFLYASITVDTIWRIRNDKSLPVAGLEAPPPEWIKLNCDIKVGLDSMCSAVVARDHLGRVLRITTARLDFVDVLCGEAAACCLAVETALDLKANFIIVENDSSVVINALTGKESQWALENYISFCNRSSPLFSSCVFSYVSRTCNFAAHNVAKWAFTHKTFGVIPVSSIPVDLLCNDREV